MSNEHERLTHGDVERIIQLVEDAGFGYMRLEVDGVELTLVKGDSVDPFAGGSGEMAPAPQAAPPAPPGPSTSPAAAAQPTVPAVDTAPAAATSAVDDDPDVVRCPMVGIFYRSPDPESPPYVEVGQSIAAGDTVGLVEVMKMYTAIRAETGGTVVEVLAENAQQVDRGQPLMRIEGR